MRTPSPSFVFLLAETLHMTVADLAATMPNVEFVRWGVYLGRKAQREQLATHKANAKTRTSR